MAFQSVDFSLRGYFQKNYNIKMKISKITVYVKTCSGKCDVHGLHSYKESCFQQKTTRNHQKKIVI